KVVVTIRKIRITSRTSMNGIRLISGSSRPWRLRKFMCAPTLLAVAVHDVDKLDCLLLHLDHEGIDQRAEVTIEHQCRHRNGNPEYRVVQGDRITIRQLTQIGAGVELMLRTEDLSHDDNRPERYHKPLLRSNRTERGQNAFLLMSSGLPCLLD